MGLIDSHAHLTFPELRSDVDGVLERCRRADVERVITIGTDLVDANAAVALARDHPDRIAAAAGFHPHEAAHVTPEDIETMAALWRDPSVVAVGELGLDYHYDFADRAVQRDVLAGQLARATTLDRPLVVHCREAMADMVAMLLDHGFRDRRVVFHCFTGSAEDARCIEAHGWRISFTGIVTFANSKALQAIARAYPNEALMVETDSPYLSPVPVRRRRPNEPAHVAHIARFLAELRNVPYNDLVEQTRRNTIEFFGLSARGIDTGSAPIASS